MPMLRRRPFSFAPPRSLLLVALGALASLPACTDTELPADEDSETHTHATTGHADTDTDPGTGPDPSSSTTAAADDDTTTGTTGDEPGEPGRELGSTPNVLCEAAAAELQVIVLGRARPRHGDRRVPR